MITVIGLGPGDLDRVTEPVLALLLDPERQVILRTLDHPAAEQLGALRQVTSCDDLYDSAQTFEDVYRGIVERVGAAASHGEVIYAVPGSPHLGEFAVRELVDSRDDVEVLAGESFLEVILGELGYDPLDRGLQVLNGHDDWANLWLNVLPNPATGAERFASTIVDCDNPAP